jgi:phosphatidylglycerol:prolipoprotein diacylglycerol transferase
MIGAYSIPAIATLFGSSIGGGRSAISALLFGWLGAEVVKYMLGINRSVGDSFALPLAVAFTFGRIGCIFAHCCDGVQGPHFIAFTYNEQSYFPTGFYEVLFHTFWVCILLVLNRRAKLRGQHLRIYISAYCVFRFVTEFWRGYPADVFGLTLFQILSVILLCIIGLVLVRESKCGGGLHA